MQVAPEAKLFGEIQPIEELPELTEDVVTVAGAEAHLRKLQDDLREAGYKQVKFNTGPLQP